MRAVYHIPTGGYCDREDSHAGTPTDREMVECSNVMGRFGGQLKDFVVVETDLSPQLLRYVDGELLPDQVKLDAIAAADTAAAVVTARREVLAGKVHAQTATLKELQEFVAGPGPE